MQRQEALRPQAEILPADPMARILDEAGLNWFILKAPIAFTPSQARETLPTEVDEQSVLYRTDNNQKLAIVPSSHRPWQPREVLDFYFSLAAFYGLALERVGHVRGGHRVWGLLNTGCSVTLPDACGATMYILLNTRCDSPLAAQATAVCMLYPGTIAVPAAIRASTIARIARSFDFLTPQDLADFGELMRECLAFSTCLEALACRTVSGPELRRAVATTFGSRRGDPDRPNTTALRAVASAMAQKRRPATALHLLQALTFVSDARDQKRWPHDVRSSSWFGAGWKRKRLAVQALARMLGSCVT